MTFIGLEKMRKWWKYRGTQGTCRPVLSSPVFSFAPFRAVSVKRSGSSFGGFSDLSGISDRPLASRPYRALRANATVQRAPGACVPCTRFRVPMRGWLGGHWSVRLGGGGRCRLPADSAGPAAAEGGMEASFRRRLPRRLAWPCAGPAGRGSCWPGFDLATAQVSGPGRFGMGSQTLSGSGWLVGRPGFSARPA